MPSRNPSRQGTHGGPFQRRRSVSRGPPPPQRGAHHDFAGSYVGGPSKPQFRPKEGDILQGGRYQWKIGTLLGEGGSGAVYKTQQNQKSYALKIELQGANPSLKIEIALFSDLTEAEHSSHFPDLLDQGQTNKLNFIVMNLVGPSVWGLRKYLFCPDEFSHSTAMQIAIQSLEALEQLHAIGWLHRDMKLQNLCVGLKEMENTLFLLDFGIAKRYKDKETGRHVQRKARVPLAGTARYMSLATMLGVEQSRKDDLETWVYVMFCAFDEERGNPWRCYHPKHQFETIFRMKEAFLKGEYEKRWFLHEIPVLLKLTQIVTYVGQLEFEEDPDYNKIRSMLLEVAQTAKINLKKPLDWAGKMNEYKQARNE